MGGFSRARGFERRFRRLFGLRLAVENVVAEEKKIGKVLIVDDDDSVRIMLEAALSAHVEVTLASSGESGLARALANHYDVILLDLVMPGVDGREFLRRFREAKPHARTVVLILSGMAATNRFSSTEVAAVLPKPFDLPQIVRVVSETANAIANESGRDIGDETARIVRESMLPRREQEDESPDKNRIN
jgi:DNA-binding response OmpR family regulator